MNIYKKLDEMIIDGYAKHQDFMEVAVGFNVPSTFEDDGLREAFVEPLEDELYEAIDKVIEETDCITDYTFRELFEIADEKLEEIVQARFNKENGY